MIFILWFEWFGVCSFSDFQTTLLHFWEKTSHTMAAIHESFKGCQENELSANKVRDMITAVLLHNNNNGLLTLSTCCLHLFVCWFDLHAADH